MLLLLAGSLSPRAAQAQEIAERGAVTATHVAADGLPVSATGDDGAVDPESRPLHTYRVPRREPAPVETSANLLFDIAGKLALVILVIFACAAGWKMVQMAAPQGLAQSTPSLQVTSTVNLAPQRSLHLVTIGQQRLLLASSPQQIAMLGTVSPESGFATVQEVAIPALPPSSLAAQPEPGDRFEHLLTRLTDALAPQAAPAPAVSAPAKRGLFEVSPDGTVVEKDETDARAPAPASMDFPGADEEDGSDSAWPAASISTALPSGAPARGTLFRVAAVPGAAGADA